VTRSPLAAALGGAARLVQALPEDRALAHGRQLGLAAHRLAIRRREIALTGLRQAFGHDLTGPQLQDLCRRNFVHYGTVLVEFLRLPRLSDAALLERFTIAGLEHVEVARTRGRGLIVLTAHLGNWEYLAAAQAALGLEIAILPRHAHAHGVDEVWQGIRRDRGLRFLHAWRSLGGVVRHLRGGGTVGMTIDQNEGGTSGARVPFFGREAGTVKAPALLAARLGCPVTLALSWRDPAGQHHATFSEELPLVTGADGTVSVDATTAAYNRRLEAAIAAHPEQWTWVHRRWKPA
jgi:KDO2-lipid IV(A) lauroyltransferase